MFKRPGKKKHSHNIYIALFERDGTAYRCFRRDMAWRMSWVWLGQTERCLRCVWPIRSTTEESSIEDHITDPTHIYAGPCGIDWLIRWSTCETLIQTFELPWNSRAPAVVQSHLVRNIVIRTILLNSYECPGVTVDAMSCCEHFVVFDYFKWPLLHSDDWLPNYHLNFRYYSFFLVGIADLGCLVWGSAAFQTRSVGMSWRFIHCVSANNNPTIVIQFVVLFVNFLECFCPMPQAAPLWHCVFTLNSCDVGRYPTRRGKKLVDSLKTLGICEWKVANFMHILEALLGPLISRSTQHACSSRVRASLHNLYSIAPPRNKQPKPQSSAQVEYSQWWDKAMAVCTCKAGFRHWWRGWGKAKKMTSWIWWIWQLYRINVWNVRRCVQHPGKALETAHLFASQMWHVHIFHTGHPSSSSNTPECFKNCDVACVDVCCDACCQLKNNLQ